MTETFLNFFRRIRGPCDNAIIRWLLTGKLKPEEGEP